MKRSEYKEIIQCFESQQCDGTTESLAQVNKVFPTVSHNTLISIYSQYVQLKTKKNYGVYSSPYKAQKYYTQYQQRSSDPSNTQGMILVQLANELDLSPALLARVIVERYLFHLSGGEAPVPKNRLTKMLRDPCLIMDPALSLEVQQCSLVDSSYGPVVDSIKHSIGEELEVHLKKTLQDHHLAFLDEDDMRKKGYDKTPDIKLQVPIAVGGRVVNWIESKALFGDDHSHENYMKDQLWSYVNRFGSGLVIYWFGFIEELATSSEQGIIIANDFPKTFTILTPA